MTSVQGTDTKQPIVQLNSAVTNASSSNGNSGAAAALGAASSPFGSEKVFADPMLADIPLEGLDPKARRYGDPHQMHPVYPQFITHDPSPPLIDMNDPSALQDLQPHRSFLTQCRGFEAIAGHDGKIAHFKTHCHVEIWNGSEQPDFQMPHPSSPKKPVPAKETVPESAPQPQQDAPAAVPKLHIPTPKDKLTWNQILDLPQLQALAKAAAEKHHNCMATKEAMLQRVKAELPAKPCTAAEALAALAALKASAPPPAQPDHMPPAHVGIYIGHLSDTMMQHLAHVHALEQADSKTGTEAERLASLQAHLTALHQHIDEHCRANDSLAQHHHIAYFPGNGFKHIKVTFLVSHPATDEAKLVDSQNHGDAHSHHMEYLRAMAEAAAHHAAANPDSDKAHFEVLHQHMPSAAEELAIRRLTLADHPALYHHVTMPRLIVVRHVHIKTSMTPGSEKSTATEPSEKTKPLPLAEAATVPPTVPSPPEEQPTTGTRAEDYKTDTVKSTASAQAAQHNPITDPAQPPNAVPPTIAPGNP